MIYSSVLRRLQTYSMKILNNFIIEHVGKCLVCGHSITLLQINRNMRSDVQMFFRDPKDLLKRYVENVIAVLDFQNGHRTRLNKAQLEQVPSFMKFSLMKFHSFSENIITSTTNSFFSLLSKIISAKLSRLFSIFHIINFFKIHGMR